MEDDPCEWFEKRPLKEPPESLAAYLLPVERFWLPPRVLGRLWVSFTSTAGGPAAAASRPVGVAGVELEPLFDPDEPWWPQEGRGMIPSKVKADHSRVAAHTSGFQLVP